MGLSFYLQLSGNPPQLRSLKLQSNGRETKAIGPALFERKNNLKNSVKKEIFNMGSNGQQVIIYLAPGTGKVRFSGTNQDNQPRLFDTSAVNDPLSQTFLAAAGDNWWRKGHMDIWYNDSAGTTHHVVADIPKSQSDDYARLAAPGVNPNLGHKVIHVHG
jgi:hypothetical protein